MSLLASNYHYSYLFFNVITFDEAMEKIENSIQCYFKEPITDFNVNNIFVKNFHRLENGNFILIHTVDHSFLHIISTNYTGNNEIPKPYDYNADTLKTMMDDFIS